MLIYSNYISHHFVKGPDNFLLKKNFSPKIKCIIMDNIKIKVFYKSTAVCLIFWHDSGLDRYGKFSLIFYTSASFFFKCLNYINLSNCKFLKLVLKFYFKKFIRLHFCNLDINSDFKIQLTIKHIPYIN